MFLSESNYASLCTFLLQLSWGLHLQFFPFADYPCAILVTAFPFFRICRLSPALYLWPHSHFFSFVDYLRSILVTAFTIFPICRLSLLYTCDCIRTFFHLQIIFPTIFVTAFAIFPIYRLSPLQTNDRICNFSHLQIISPPNQWPHSQFFSFADYLLRHTSPTTVSGDAYRQDYPVYGQWILARLASRDAG